MSTTQSCRARSTSSFVRYPGLRVLRHLELDLVPHVRLELSLGVGERLLGCSRDVELRVHLVDGGAQGGFGVQHHRGEEKPHEVVVGLVPVFRHDDDANPPALHLAKLLVLCAVGDLRQGEVERQDERVARMARDFRHRVVVVALLVMGDELLVRRRRLRGLWRPRQDVRLVLQGQQGDEQNGRHASSFDTSFPLTSVRRKSRPWNLYVSFSWSIPSRCSIVACRSCTSTGSSTML